MAERVIAWPEEPLMRRLVKCRVLLYQSGVLTESEMRKIDARLDKLAAQERGESEDTLFHKRFWAKPMAEKVDHPSGIEPASAGVKAQPGCQQPVR